jgi:hypothetical protein
MNDVLIIQVNVGWLHALDEFIRTYAAAWLSVSVAAHFTIYAVNLTRKSRFRQFHTRSMQQNSFARLCLIHGIAVLLWPLEAGVMLMRWRRV